jgi:hypothetical protein
MVSCGAIAAAEPLQFNRDIRPILSDTCFACHGPDSATRKAGLRLDKRDVAIDHGAIAPGDATASELIKRITAGDPADRMPPPESNLSLSADEIARLQQWISEGAEYQPHWSLVPPPEAVTVPAVDAPTAIDAFVRARLQQEELAPSPQADKETLIRRLSFDLIGLPPTVEEIDAFLADDSPNAYEHLVDRLLASPAYGERMARDWLDVARYADTFGYQNDIENDVWPWRDWVIRAFNDNLPYDDFIRWQLAGDLLEQPTQDQRLATAFNRLHRQTNEGGSVEEEFRLAYVADRVETFSNAFLGLTMQCARCHDHKFDPISQKDYFALSAFFDDIDESGIYSHFTKTAPSPSMLLYREGEEATHNELKAFITSAEAEAETARAEAAERVDAWLQNDRREVKEFDPILHWPLETIAEGKTTDLADPKRPGSVSLNPTTTDGRVGEAFLFDGENSVESDAADFERTDPFSIALWLKATEHVPTTVVLHRTKAASDAASRGYDLLLEDGKPTFSLTHFWPGNAIRIQTKEPLPLDTWTHIAVRYDGSSKAAGLTLYLNGAPADTAIIRDNLFKTIRYESDKPKLTIAARFRDVGFKDGAIDELYVFDRQLSTLEIEALAQLRTINAHFEQLAIREDDAAKDLLEEHYTLNIDLGYRLARAKRSEAWRQESDFVEGLQNIMVMRDMAAPRQAYILERGEYNLRGEPVDPGTPENVLPFSANLPHNRLGLAEWLLDPRHPLTARVAVNRYWQLFFGRGLVETQEGFGSQGSAPTHPDLLDYLARWFIDNDWDVKALCKELVLSATYRQQSAPTPELLARDPQNALLARGPRHRLSAEQIRDEALAASGLLVGKIGGPSVKPYQPEGIWKDASQVDYTPDTGDGLYRRSVYTFIKRTVPPPSMLTFDATSREVCVVRRERTITPLQALVLLNDPQYVEAARVLAAKTVAAHPEEADKRIDALFRSLTSRLPSAEEREFLRQAYAEQRSHFAQHTEGASQYVQVGDSPAAEGIDPAELAATTALTQAIMNLDEFQVKR